MILTDPTKLNFECRDVSIFEAADIIKKLELELATSKTPGVGLSANQIGINAKVCIIRTQKVKLDLANPKIVAEYDLGWFEDEGCLSFPAAYLTTKRFNEIVVGDLFHPAGVVLWGFEAIVAQHEIAHCFGKTMYDAAIRMPEPNDFCFCGSGKKFKKCHQSEKIK